MNVKNCVLWGTGGSVAMLQRWAGRRWEQVLGKGDFPMVKKLTLAATAAFLSFGIAGAAQASLIGQTVTCSDNGAFANATCQPGSASVGPGPEFEIFTAIASAPLWSIDVGADSITMTFLGLSVGASDPARVTLGDLFW